MSEKMQDTEKKEDTALAEENNDNTDIYMPSDPEEQEDSLAVSVKKGLEAPFARVLLRLLLAILILSAVAIFANGVLKYNELMREAERLEEKRDALEDEIAEMRYLIDSPIDYDYIVRVAREKLGLHLPDEIIYYNDAHD